ncbi:MAG: hypothetical protein QJT81_08750 [Candidatus Thiothrix putei]|uniref:DUF4332 domain-containing protein n=1 Tax=Candidatus Thiothrix putei TaxID=3080811 RepID=A0AA95KKX3_9GAMM|nr:MAG: hypothetical protein QJT81_08750 [Candidatus Thiothrix putei]
MNTAPPPYTFGMATGEIISLLLLSFVVGILLCRLLRQMGICCRPKKKTIPIGITPVPAGKYHTRDFDIHTPNLRTNPVASSPELELPQLPHKQAVTDVYVPKVQDKPTLTLPEVTPETNAEFVVSTNATPEVTLELPPLPEIDPLLAAIDPHKPIIDIPDTELNVVPEEATMHNTSQPAETWEPAPLLASIDPHKPIIDPPDIDILETSSLDPLLLAIDPHKPIIDPPDMQETSSLDPLLLAIDPHKPIIDPPDELETMKTDSLLDAIDPHKPIVDLPDMPDATSNPTSKDNTLGMFNDWLHKAKESVEHLTEKATPAANEWLHKAKDSVEHLKEKATPVSNDWLHKAKDSVEHLKEKAAPVSNDWLHKAKELGNDFSSKGNTIGSETLAKGSSTLAALAASAKELTEKLTSNLSIKQDDLQKLTGIGPTFTSILHRAGIHTYQQLAETSPQKLQALLIVEDEQFSQHDTSSWPKQAALAAQGEWEQLKAYQESL